VPNSLSALLHKPVLAIDTTLGACSAAVGDETGPLATRFAQTGTGQAELLLPMIVAVMEEAALAPPALGHIAVTIGPGSFAGTRIGLSTARAMALALHIPLIGLTSLESVAAAVTDPVPRIVAFDARKGELYVQGFDADLKPLTDPLAVTPEGAVMALNTMPADSLILGSGAAALGMVMGRERAVRAPFWPDAATFLAYAAGKPAHTGDPLRPLYLRAPGAMPYRRMGGP
jgi:tRNA threonylcarbamoyladenosine biosynthesis protein TsaB